MLTKNIRTRKLRGFTLTEAAIVLGIVGLILGAIWTAASSVYANQRVNAMNQATIKIMQSVRSLYASQFTIAVGNLTEQMISAGAIPSDMVRTSTIGSNAWNGTTLVGGSSGGNGIVIEYSNVPKDACIKMLSTVAGAVRDAGLATETTAIATVDTWVGLATASALLNPMTVATATTLCNRDISKVQFGFMLK